MTPAPRKGMDARSLAERLYKEYGRKGSWNYFDKRMIEAIAAEIEDAYAEARREALEEAATYIGGLHVVKPAAWFANELRALSNQEPKTSGEKPATERD